MADEGEKNAAASGPQSNEAKWATWVQNVQAGQALSVGYTLTDEQLMEARMAFTLYAGADSETVDDGSAAHEPVTLGADAGPELSGNSLWLSALERRLSAADDPLATDRELIERLKRQNEDLKLLARNAVECMHDAVREMKAAVAAADDSASKDGPNVAGDIERVIDHLVQGRTTRDQRKGVGDAIERAERDAAVGRALR